MNKRDFKVYFDEQLSGMSLDKQIEELQKLQNVYIPELINARRKKQGTWVPPGEEYKYIYCDKCQKYHLKTKWKVSYSKEIRTEPTYIDAGYGDDDMMGDVEYMITYHRCPICGYEKETSKLYIKTLREWNRREGRK